MESFSKPSASSWFIVLQIIRGWRTCWPPAKYSLARPSHSLEQANITKAVQVVRRCRVKKSQSDVNSKLFCRCEVENIRTIVMLVRFNYSTWNSEPATVRYNFMTMMMIMMMVVSNYWMRFSRLWRFLQIKEGVIHRGRRPRRSAEICRILHILRKPNSIIALLFIQNIFPFSKEFRHFVVCFTNHQKQHDLVLRFSWSMVQ